MEKLINRTNSLYEKILKKALNFLNVSFHHNISSIHRIETGLRKTKFSRSQIPNADAKIKLHIVVNSRTTLIDRVVVGAGVESTSKMETFFCYAPKVHLL